MSDHERRRVEVLLPMRTVLLVAAALLVLAALWKIGDTFLIVFVGIFLGLVFEYPVRFVMKKTGWSRGLAATVTVLGTALVLVVLGLVLLVPLVGGVRDYLHDLPQTVQALRDSGDLGPIGDSGAAANVQEGADQVSLSVPDAISAVLGVAGDVFGVFLAGFTILFICLFLLTDIGNLKGALGSMLMPGEEERWLSVWERITTSISRWAIGVVVIAAIAGTTQGVTAWLLGSSYAIGLGVIAGLLDMIPNIGATMAGFILVPTLWAEEGVGGSDRDARRAARLPAAREQHPHPEDPGQGGQPLGVHHHHRRDALRCVARRAGCAHRGASRRDGADLRAGADEGTPQPGGGGQAGARATRRGDLALAVYDRAFCLSVLNSASVIAPLSSRALAFSISAAEPPPLAAAFWT